MALTVHRKAPAKGLPGLLPRGETLLWQGRPDWVPLFRHAFLGDWVAIYFGALMVWRAVDGWSFGAPTHEVVAHTVGLGVMGLIVLALLAVLAFATARTAVYSITNRRVAMKVGLALTTTANIPFKRVAGADLRLLDGGRGDVSLAIGGKDRFAYLALWPHARPFRFQRPEPMMRAVPDAPAVARLLGEALRAYQAEHGIDAPVPQAEAAEQRPPHAVMTPAE
jgi:hypothetical protein